MEDCSSCVSETETNERAFLEGSGGSVNSLRVLPVAGGQRQTSKSCAKLILAAEMECGSFVSAAKQLFGEHMALYAGILWVAALETDSSFGCRNSNLRQVTILAASKLADLIGATRQTPDSISIYPDSEFSCLEGCHSS
jgi:hypothetical protein